MTGTETIQISNYSDLPGHQGYTDGGGRQQLANFVARYGDADKPMRVEGHWEADIFVTERISIQDEGEWGEWVSITPDGVIVAQEA